MLRSRPPLRIIAANVRPLALALGVLSALAGCPGGADRSPPPSPAPASPAGAATTPGGAGTSPAAADGRPLVLVVGTSLTAGLGVDPKEAYPAILQEKIDAAGLGYRVVAAGVSGETSAGALRRVDWLMRQRIAVLVLETGANDGLRGQDPGSTRANIQAIFDRARRQEPPPRLVLIAMEALPNYGEDYRRRFREIYPQLSRENDAELVPFLLEGVAGERRLNQADGVHPTAEGHRRVAENVWTALRPVLEKEANSTEPTGVPSPYVGRDRVGGQ